MKSNKKSNTSVYSAKLKSLYILLYNERITVCCFKRQKDGVYEVVLSK